MLVKIQEMVRDHVLSLPVYEWISMASASSPVSIRRSMSSAVRRGARRTK